MQFVGVPNRKQQATSRDETDFDVVLERLYGDVPVPVAKLALLAVLAALFVVVLWRDYFGQLFVRLDCFVFCFCFVLFFVFVLFCFCF